MKTLLPLALVIAVGTVAAAPVACNRVSLHVPRVTRVGAGARAVTGSE